MNHIRKSLLKNQTGTTLVEVLVAIGLSAIMLPALVTAVVTSNMARPTATQQVVATGMLQSLSEATRSVREGAWSAIDTDGTYHPVQSGNAWALASGNETSGNYTEQVVISDASRDSSGNIVTSGGTVDPSTKLVTASVSWTNPRSTTISSQFYLTRWLDEGAWTQTSATDFTGDTLTNTVVTNTTGGEVQLTSGQASGTLESSTFDAGAAVSANELDFTTVTPTGTSVEFQIASNTDNSTWNYVGPDGTSATYYTSAGAVPLAAESGRYFRYKATLTGTSSTTPIIDDVTLTYSP